MMAEPSNARRARIVFGLNRRIKTRPDVAGHKTLCAWESKRNLLFSYNTFFREKNRSTSRIFKRISFITYTRGLFLCENTTFFFLYYIPFVIVSYTVVIYSSTLKNSPMIFEIEPGRFYELI